MSCRAAVAAGPSGSWVESCRFPHAQRRAAAVVVALEAGCLCYPDDREQALCFHHAMRSEPRGAVTVLRVVEGTSAFVREVLAERYVLPA